MSGPPNSTTPINSFLGGYVTKYVWTDGNLIYLGKAPPGTAVTEPYWQIKKFTYDGSNNVTDKQWAGGSDSFTKIWNNYATYTYS